MWRVEAAVFRGHGSEPLALYSSQAQGRVVSPPETTAVSTLLRVMVPRFLERFQVQWNHVRPNSHPVIVEQLVEDDP